MSKRAPKTVRIFTIGFTEKSAAGFFAALKSAGVRRVLDIRLKPDSQLAGFAKKRDLPYFLGLIGIAYAHAPELAPTKELLEGYREKKIAWNEYEKIFPGVLAGRDALSRFRPEDLDGACLLCSEAEADHCHRRLVAEAFREKWGGVEIMHL